MDNQRKETDNELKISRLDANSATDEFIHFINLAYYNVQKNWFYSPFVSAKPTSRQFINMLQLIFPRNLQII